METYFLDTSPIVKYYVPEQGQSLILTLCDPVQGHDLYISQATLVEVVASICRKTIEAVFTSAGRMSLTLRRVNRWMRKLDLKSG